MKMTKGEKATKRVQTLQNSKRGGYYWVGDKPYISATSAISVIDKPALRYWFGTQVYLSYTADPTLNQKECLASPWKATKKATDRGSKVHHLTETPIDDVEALDEPEEIKGYLRAYKKWETDFKPEILEVEKTVFSEKYGFAGSLDRIMKVGDKIVLLDIKTGKDIYDEVYLQLSAYKQALKEEGYEVEEMAPLLLKENGDYKYAPTSDDFLEPFLNCLGLWKFQNRGDIEKIKTYLKLKKEKNEN